MYSSDPSVFKHIIDLVVDDWKQLEDSGIEIPAYGTVFPIVLGNKGDWSYLVSWICCVIVLLPTVLLNGLQKFINSALYMFECFGVAANPGYIGKFGEVIPPSSQRS